MQRVKEGANKQKKKNVNARVQRVETKETDRQIDIQTDTETDRQTARLRDSGATRYFAWLHSLLVKT